MRTQPSQLVTTLQHQVEALAPLRHSQAQLQAYYTRMLGEYEQLLATGDQEDQELMIQWKYMEQVRRQVEEQFSRSGQQLRELEQTQARIEMESRQLVSQEQALQGKEELELNQKQALLKRKQELVELRGKTQFNIDRYKELVHRGEMEATGIEQENKQIGREIRKLEQLASKIRQINAQTEQNVLENEQESQAVLERIGQAREKLECYEKLIATREKVNRETAQQLIDKTEELAKLQHQREYMDKVLQGEKMQQHQLQKAETELETVLAIRKQKLALLQQENAEYQAGLTSEAVERARNEAELARLRDYLQTLVTANEQLFLELERSCAQDRKVQVMLSEKLEKLVSANDKIEANEVLHCFDHNSLGGSYLLKGAHSASSPDFKIMTSPQAGSLPKGSPTSSQVNRTNSTWENFSKENFRTEV